MEIDVDRDGVGCGPYLRVRVWVDSTKPLIRSNLINSFEQPLWIAFKYE